jgi:hypothetical protein
MVFLWNREAKRDLEGWRAKVENNNETFFLAEEIAWLWEKLLLLGCIDNSLGDLLCQR